MTEKRDPEFRNLPIAVVALLDRTDRLYDYSVPENLLSSAVPGMRVLVPFRREWLTGLVIERIRSSEHASTRPILRALDPVPLLDSGMLGFTRWLSEYYLSGWGPALRAVLPPSSETPIRKTLRLTSEGRKGLSGSKRMGSASRLVLEYLAGREKGFRLETVVNRFIPAGKKTGSPGDFFQKTLRPLIKKGWIELVREAPPDFLSRFLAAGVSGIPAGLPGEDAPPENPEASVIGLKDEDRDDIHAALEQGKFFAGFIPGNTPASWLAAMVRKTRQEGRNVLILVPEIGRVREWEARLTREGLGPLTLLHSDLPDKTRRKEWLALRSGKGGIVLGTRMAVLSPLTRTGLIVVLEEDDPAYKQEESPRYHARDVAVLRASREKAVILLAAAQASIETHSNIQKKKYRLIENAGPPDGSLRPGLVRILPLGKQPGKPYVSDELLRDISLRLKRLEPVVLVLNQKGFGSALYCRDCGMVLRCPRCSVSAVFSKGENTLGCPYCGWKRTPPDICGECRGRKLTLLGFGTERAEAFFKKTFPGARITRVEGGNDGVRRSREALDRLNRGEMDIVIGTQVLLSGPSPERSGLVGLLQADGAFHHPDFRASEKTFRLVSRLLAFASGSDVVIQTFFPDHESIAWAEKRSAESYYKTELEQRKTLGYPPFTRLAVITVKSASDKRAGSVAGRLAEALGGAPGFSDSQVLGPAPSIRKRLFGKYRWQVMVKAENGPGLQKALKPVIQKIRMEKNLAGVWFEVDVDPVHVG